MDEREIIRVCLTEDGQLDVTVGEFCPEEKADRLANDVANSVIRLLGDAIVDEADPLKRVSATRH